MSKLNKHLKSASRKMSHSIKKGAKAITKTGMSIGEATGKAVVDAPQSIIKGVKDLSDEVSGEKKKVKLDVRDSRRRNEYKEAMLYYLYMMSDGEVSYSEEKIFNEICKELNLDEDGKQSVIDSCKEVAKASWGILDFLVKIDEQVGRKDASTLARIIWNLVYLGYADTDYSDDEKRIVQYLLEKWQISDSVYLEMVETADTILALVQHKDWVISAFPKGRERDEKEKRIDTEMDMLLSDIMLTIEELTL